MLFGHGPGQGSGGSPDVGRNERRHMTRPNIVLIMADQLSPHWTGAYGHAVARTPHMDALAARGVRFDAAYCNSPLCAPSRFSFMSGQLPSKVDAFDNASEFKASVPTFAHYMKAAGYRTCLSGKMHFVGPDQKHGFEDRITTDIYPSDFAWVPNWERADERIDKWYHNMETVRDSGVAQATYQIDYDDEVGFAARRWLFDRARDKAAGEVRPFLMVASYFHPHDPYVARPEWWDLYDDDEIDLPDVVMRRDEQDPLSARVMDGIGATDLTLSEAEIIKARRAYLANTSYFDSKVGEIVRTLEETGEIDNTVIIVTSDHGDMLGERGLWFKMSYFEHSARVPLIVAGPGVASRAVGNVCSLVDLMPTFLEIGGYEGELAEPLDGQSLWGLLGGGDEGPDVAVGEYCAEMTPCPLYMIRRGALKYIHSAFDPPQLYDLAADPKELRNVAADPDYAEAAAGFAAEVAARWDDEALRARVMETQRSRRVLNEIMQAHAPEHWDYNPPRDASQEYVRNHMDWTVTAARYRFPREG